MTNYTFDANSSEKKLQNLNAFYNDYLLDNLSVTKALDLCSNSWHLIDWILKEYHQVHNFTKIEDLRNALYPSCPSLKIMHDITTSSKHLKVSSPKSKIGDTRIHKGGFDKSFGKDFDISNLQIILEDGQVLQFTDEISKVILFWNRYFINELRRTE